LELPVCSEVITTATLWYTQHRNLGRFSWDCKGVRYTGFCAYSESCRKYLRWGL